MPINQVLLSNTFNEFRTTVNEITNVVNDLTANVLSGQIVANTITVGQVSSNLIPSANITYDLGSSTNRWNDLYLSGNTIYLGDAEIKFDNGELSFTAGGSAIPVANINASNITSGTLSSARLATSGVSAGGYGSASLIPVIVVDDKGRITSAANVSVAGVSDFEYHSANANFVIYTADGGSYSTSIGQDLGTTANVTFNKVTVSGPPGSTNELATKGYVDAFVEGLHIHEAVEAATNNTLTALTGGTVTYNNGTAGVGATLTLQNALTVLDGYTLQNTNRVMVKNEANTAHNGIYTWATGGTVLTRATDYDTPVEMAGGDFVFVIYGTLYADTGWVQSEPVTTVGTSAVNFIQFSGAGTYTAGTGLALNGNEFRIANTAVTAGGYGSASQVPVLVIDSQGRITSAANVNVAGVSSFTYHTGNTTFSIYTADGSAFNTTVNGSGFTALNAANVTSGTLAVVRGGTGVTTSTGSGSVVLSTSPTLVTPALGTPASGNGVNLTFLSASNLGTGTVPDARFPATLPAANGVNLTFLNASNLGTGLVPTARLASGTANSTTFLRGDQTWQSISAGLTVTNDTVSNSNAYYPALATAISGSISGVTISSTKLNFNPATGQLNATTFNSLSDLNFKKNVTKITNATELVQLLDGFEFEWKDNDKKSSGVIAQYIEKVLPHLVDNDNNQKTVNYSGLIAYLIEAVKELNARVSELEKQQ